MESSNFKEMKRMAKKIIARGDKMDCDLVASIGIGLCRIKHCA